MERWREDYGSFEYQYIGFWSIENLNLCGSGDPYVIHRDVGNIASDGCIRWDKNVIIDIFDIPYMFGRIMSIIASFASIITIMVASLLLCATRNMKYIRLLYAMCFTSGLFTSLLFVSLATNLCHNDDIVPRPDWSFSMNDDDENDDGQYEAIECKLGTGGILAIASVVFWLFCGIAIYRLSTTSTTSRVLPTN